MNEQLELPFPVADCWDLIDRAPLQITCKVSVSLQLQVLREIASYLLKGNQCFASDEYFASKIQKSIAQIKNTFRALREQGVVHFVEQPRAGMRGRGSRAKLKVIDWGRLSLMVDQRTNRHGDQRLTSDRPTANQRTDQRLTSDRPTANQHTDQRLTISRNYSGNTKDQQTTEPVVVADASLDEASQPSWIAQVDTATIADSNQADAFEPVRDRLKQYEPVPVAKSSESVDAAMKRGWTVDYCNRLIEFAIKNQTPAGHLCRWFIYGSPPEEFARLEASRRIRGPLRSGPKLDHHKHRQERLRNQQQYTSQLSTMELLRLETLRNSEARA